jgi:hypothetical protein
MRENHGRGSVFMRTSKLFSAGLVFCFSLLAASQIRADGILNYEYKSGSNTFTWQLPTNPMIAPGNAFPGLGFTIPDVSFSENGVSMVGTLDFFNFNSIFNGGFDLWNGGGYLINAMGPQLYTGPETAPTMVASSFSGFIDFGSDTSPNAQPIPGGGSAQVKSTPEPSTLSLLAVGLAIGLALTFLRFAKISPGPSTH